MPRASCWDSKAPRVWRKHSGKGFASSVARYSVLLKLRGLPQPSQGFLFVYTALCMHCKQTSHSRAGSKDTFTGRALRQNCHLNPNNSSIQTGVPEGKGQTNQHSCDERHNSQVWNNLGFKLMVAIIMSPHTQISSLPYKELKSI